MSLLDEIKRQIDKYKVISFDIFDTLLLRPYVKPTDLFLHLEKLENAQGFAGARIEAERKARKIHADVEDISFDEIYEEISPKYKNFKQKELDLEREVLCINPEMKEVYEYALNQGKRIIIISDMYLPGTFLTSVLQEKGYKGFDNLYVSGECKKTKLRNTLYRFVLENLKINTKEVLHVGDNYRSDYENPQKLGIATCFQEKLISRYMKQNEKARLFLEKYPDNLEASVMIMSFALHWLENKNEEFWSRIGYEYGGPVMYGYMRWVEEQVLKDGIKEVLFVARDGYSLQKVFDIFGHKDIKTHYVYAPRQLQTNCNLNEALNSNSASTTCLAFLNGVKIENKKIRFEIQKIVSENAAKKFILEHFEEFRQMEQNSRESYKNYLDSLHLEQKDVAMVDTTTTFLSAQRLIADMLPDRHVKGMYWCIFDYAYDHYSDKYDFIKYSVKHNRGQFLSWDFMEYLMTSPEYPIKDIINNKPIYREDIPDAEMQKSARAEFISEGTLSFATYFKRLPGANCLSLTEKMVTDWCNNLFSLPSDMERNILSKCSIALDSSHLRTRFLYDFNKTTKIDNNNNSQITMSLFGLPLFSISAIEFISHKDYLKKVKYKIKFLKIPLFKLLHSRYAIKFSFLFLRLFNYYNDDKKLKFSFLYLPIFKVNKGDNFSTLSDMNSKSSQKDDRLFINRMIEKKLSTFALHQQTFSRFKNINQGKDIVIIATGPSLQKYHPLENVINVGVNHAYKHKQIALDYLFVQDYLGFDDGMSEINAYRGNNCIKFYGLTTEYEGQWMRVIPESYAIAANALRYRTDWEQIPKFKNSFAYDISTQALGCFGSIVFPALQFALWTNPRRIYLVGCDCTSAGHFDGSESEDLTTLLRPWHEFKQFASIYYPEVEIISVNPVGLAGVFNDVYQE